MMKIQMSDRSTESLNRVFSPNFSHVIEHILTAYFMFRRPYMDLEYVLSLVVLYLNHLLEVR